MFKTNYCQVEYDLLSISVNLYSPLLANLFDGWLFDAIITFIYTIFMGYQNSYVEHACYSLIDGLILKDEAEVTAAANILADSNVPFHDSVEIESNNFDEDHLRFAIMASACSRLIDDWSYFIFAAHMYSKEASWLHFIKDIKSSQLREEGIASPDERLGTMLYLSEQYNEHIAPHHASFQGARKLGKNLLRIIKRNQ